MSNEQRNEICNTISQKRASVKQRVRDSKVKKGAATLSDRSESPSYRRIPTGLMCMCESRFKKFAV